MRGVIAIIGGRQPIFWPVRLIQLMTACWQQECSLWWRISSQLQTLAMTMIMTSLLKHLSNLLLTPMQPITAFATVRLTVGNTPDVSWDALATTTVRCMDCRINGCSAFTNKFWGWGMTSTDGKNEFRQLYIFDRIALQRFKAAGKELNCSRVKVNHGFTIKPPWSLHKKSRIK